LYAGRDYKQASEQQSRGAAIQMALVDLLILGIVDGQVSDVTEFFFF
jgi:hypothetical protein